MGGGDTVSPSLSSDEDSLLEQEFQDYPFEFSALLRGDNSSLKVDDLSVSVENDFMPERLDVVDSQVSRDSLYLAANRKRACSVYNQVLRSYDELQCRTKSLEEAKLRILRYKPGIWTEKVGGMELKDYIVPKTVSLLVVGPEKSGKSSLINRISRAFDDDKYSPERAQVSYNCNDGDGTYFLQENMVLKGSSSFCLYDTRSLSDNESENTEMLKRWMTEGVRHGELVLRNSDGPDLRNKLKCKSHRNLHCSNMTRKVNFVIFVISGLSVLNAMDSGDERDDGYNNMIATMFNCPFLSFKDDKPVLVVTHGDFLSLSDRARVRVHLGELLGIPPKKQIFDIPVAEDCDPATDLTIIDLLRYSLEHADKNFPVKGWFLSKTCKIRQPGSLIMVLILGIAIISALVHNAYVGNGHNLHIPPKDAPIGRNVNNVHSPGLDTVSAPKADALHVPQTDAPTGRSADDFPSQADYTSATDTRERETKLSRLPQKETTVYPSTTDVPTKDDPTRRNADNFPQAGFLSCPMHCCCWRLIPRYPVTKRQFWDIIESKNSSKLSLRLPLKSPSSFFVHEHCF
ncbi:Phosphate import ATP-binding protein like [Heracleum sosnowskyi]|uniref:Phosphate import ATP-binding protein like n=1 Tax=Heracleum sosnowskyi TaxID=360622 RepID=A0AAD8GWM6_9APIA|nr:Phosphate import ATP-binding protein like [Heracleum sosnowskyi]